MASAREIKRRIRGINSILQITKAMELVSTAKLRKARIRLEATRPYFETVLDDIQEILGLVGDAHPLVKKREEKTILYIVLTSDRGLAGGYNANVQRLAEETAKKRSAKAKLFVVGSKAKEYFARRNYDILESYTGISDAPSFEHAKNLATTALDLYRDGTVDAIDLVYTRFESTLKYTPKVERLLPSEELKAKADKKASTLVEFEPSPEAVLDYLIPMYVESCIYGALIEAAASEQGARRLSMENATDNANEMIEELETNFNRARQAAITNEITEIVSSADAVQ
ncbi:F-ATPase gamma subunit [Aedoeadaptatus ivorii]|uniref:ATP synthase gamma chain n=1 Tax=Aedoeadaptatus ivorii TaxID=54006 RepID=A0A448UZM0_9FIRM|nr:ATP synthase F1 subunit gamma [Peptoniphilus ivorii]MDQ0508562.1 F-type H+-transporting ATPase subunit gamma [Peptoniphilus ivorii]VEJ34438.1 F-ATPase gamma subunit [Peptoniphilus ivorii]